MGFNKRFVNIDGIIIRYKNGGLKEVDQWLYKADALIVNAVDNSEHIVNKLAKGDFYGAELIIEYELRRQGIS